MAYTCLRERAASIMGHTEKHSEHSIVTMAVGGAIRLDALRRGLEAALKRVGWIERPAQGEAEGETLQASVYQRAARAWAVLEGGSQSLVTVGRETAQACRSALVIHEAAGRQWPAPAAKAPAAPGYEMHVRSFEATANGDLRPAALPPTLDEGKLGTPHGDLDETAKFFLWQLVDPEAIGGDRKWNATLWRPAPPLPDMPRRLVDLARVIELAGSWTIEQQGDRWLVRVEGPTLGKRMSALTDEDLALLRQAVVIAPG
jgi:hypothetical protein